MSGERDEIDEMSDDFDESDDAPDTESQMSSDKEQGLLSLDYRRRLESKLDESRMLRQMQEYDFGFGSDLD